MVFDTKTSTNTFLIKTISKKNRFCLSINPSNCPMAHELKMELKYVGFQSNFEA
jgi:hypothetical protein